MKVRICGLELPRHVVVIVVTIAADYPGISELGKPVGTYFVRRHRHESAKPCAAGEEQASRGAFRLVEAPGWQGR